MVTKIWVNIGSGSGLLPDGTKPLPEPMLTDHQQSPVTLILGQFHKRCLNHQSLKCVWKLHVQNFIQVSQGPMSWDLARMSRWLGTRIIALAVGTRKLTLFISLPFIFYIFLKLNSNFVIIFSNLTLIWDPSIVCQTCEKKPTLSIV